MTKLNDSNWIRIKQVLDYTVYDDGSVEKSVTSVVI